MKLYNVHEKKQRGSADFPFEYHDINEKHARYEMPYHWHEEMEILHVVEGVFSLTVEETTYELSQGDVAIISPFMLHGGTPKNCRYDCSVFDPIMLLKCPEEGKKFISALMSGKAQVSPVFDKQNALVKRLLEPMFQELRAHPKESTLIVIGSLYCFFGNCYQQGAYTLYKKPYFKETRHMMKLKQAFEIIENEYQNPPTLEDLAKRVGLSTKYFCHFFKEVTHDTPMHYITYFRMEMAANLLSGTDKNVTEVAYLLGYQDINYFVRVFKKHKGVTPKQYQLEMKGEFTC